MIIAERDLRYLAADGTSIAIPIVLFVPQEAKRCWVCRYTIGWPEGVEENAGYGDDSVQALMLAIQTIGASLYFSPYHQAGRLKWSETPDGFGFPASSDARDTPVGYNETFDAGSAGRRM